MIVNLQLDLTDHSFCVKASKYMRHDRLFADGNHFIHASLGFYLQCEVDDKQIQQIRQNNDNHEKAKSFIGTYLSGDNGLQSDLRFETIGE